MTRPAAVVGEVGSMAKEGCQVGACVRGQYVVCVSFFLTACQWLEERLAGWGIYLAVHRECGDAEQGAPYCVIMRGHGMACTHDIAEIAKLRAAVALQRCQGEEEIG
jgi:hypothetical protein